jgi:hypothetical protein
MYALDWSSAYIDPCVDCADLTPATYRTVRGGSFFDTGTDNLRSGNRLGPGVPPLATDRRNNVGARCARAP